MESQQNATGIFNNVPAGDAMITVRQLRVARSGGHRDRGPAATPIVLDGHFVRPHQAAMVNLTRSSAVPAPAARAWSCTACPLRSIPVPVRTSKWAPMSFSSTDWRASTPCTRLTRQRMCGQYPRHSGGPAQPFNLYAQAVAPTTCPDTEDGTVVLNFFRRQRRRHNLQHGRLHVQHGEYLHLGTGHLHVLRSGRQRVSQTPCPTLKW